MSTAVIASFLTLLCKRVAMNSGWIGSECNDSNFLVVWCGCRWWPQLPITRLYGPGWLSYPARFFATACNFGSDPRFVIQSAIYGAKPVQWEYFLQL